MLVLSRDRSAADASHHFEAHAAVVVRALPRPDLAAAGVIRQRVAVAVQDGEPLAALVVDDVVLDVGPQLERRVAVPRPPGQLVGVQPADDALGLRPPVLETLDDLVAHGLVQHRPVGVDAVREHRVGADGSVLYEAVGDEVIEGLKHWWPQAEGVVGWLNAYQLTGRTRYRDAALKLWSYIEDHVVDHERGEWFAVLDRHGNPLPDHPGSCKIGPWKCPYHDGRVCLEVMRRIGS